MEIVEIHDKNFPGGVNFFYLPEYLILIDVGTGKTDYSSIERIDAIILTHGHPDHINGVHELSERFNCQIFMHEHDDFMVPFEFDKLQDEVELNGLKLQVIHTPGHSPGGVCLYEPNEKILFSGDTIFANGVVGRFDLAGSNFEELFESVEKLSKLDIERIYPGHGRSVLENGNEHVKMALETMKSFANRIK